MRCGWKKDHRAGEANEVPCLSTVSRLAARKDEHQKVRGSVGSRHALGLGDPSLELSEAAQKARQE